MNVIKFKTSLKCGGCVNAIRPFLNTLEDIRSWNVDLNDPEKTLTVETELESTSELQKSIIDAFLKAGYKAEPV